MPARVVWDGGAPTVEWILLGDRPFKEPYFDDTIQAALYHPFHHAFRRGTSMETLGDLFAPGPAVAPRGFVFHMSRCGSTLVSRMLQSTERNVVLSEPPPIDSVLRAHIQNPSLTTEARAEWLGWMVSALGRKRRPVDEAVFVKFDCWSVAEMTVAHRAFPGVPWIFLYRDPVEVLVSHLNAPSLWSIPGGLPPTVFGLDPAEVADVPRDEYCARLLGRICEVAVDRIRDTPGGLLINYSSLPDCFYSDVATHFGLDYSPAEIAQIRETASFNSKAPWFVFDPDTHRKQSAATDRIRELADRWIRPFYDKLEAERAREASV